MLGKKKELEIPVYLFMGFLEAGKTTFIQETLEEDYFNDGERTLLFACEEGMEQSKLDFSREILLHDSARQDFI